MRPQRIGVTLLTRNRRNARKKTNRQDASAKLAVSDTTGNVKQLRSKYFRFYVGLPITLKHTTQRFMEKDIIISHIYFKDTVAET